MSVLTHRLCQFQHRLPVANFEVEWRALIGTSTALSSNITLRSLTLRSNQVTNRSGPALQTLLRGNTVLTSIDFKENSICYAEAVAQLSDYAVHEQHIVGCQI